MKPVAGAVEDHYVVEGGCTGAREGERGGRGGRRRGGKKVSSSSGFMAKIRIDSNPDLFSISPGICEAGGINRRISSNGA